MYPKQFEQTAVFLTVQISKNVRQYWRIWKKGAKYVTDGVDCTTSGELWNMILHSQRNMKPSNVRNILKKHVHPEKFTIYGSKENTPGLMDLLLTTARGWGGSCNGFQRHHERFAERPSQFFSVSSDFHCLGAWSVCV